MNKIQLKDFLRSLKKQLARFISIVLILSLGVGFYAGINAAQPDMIKSANLYYQNTKLMDIRSYNPFGYSEDEIEKIKNLENVSETEKSFSSDLLMSVGENKVASKIYSIPSKGLKQNNLVLLEGRMPEKSGEIVIDGGRYSPKGLKVGSDLTLTVQRDLEDKKDIPNTEDNKVLNTENFKVVGIVQSPMYISFERGHTNIADGKISIFGYIPEKDFALKRPNEIFIRVKNVEELDASKTEYKEKVTAVKNSLISLGEKEIGDKTLDLKSELEKKEKELIDKKIEIRSALSKAENDLKEAKNKIESSKNQLNTKESEGRKKLEDSKRQLDDATSQYNSSLAQYNEGKSLFDQNYNSYLSAKDKISSEKSKLDSSKSLLDKSKAEIDENAKTLQNTKLQLDEAKISLDNNREQYLTSKQIIPQLTLSITSLRNVITFIGDKSALTVGEYDYIIKNLSSVDINIASKVTSVTNSTDKNNINIIKTVVNQTIESYKENLQKAESGVKKYEDTQIMYTEGIAKVEKGQQELESAKTAYEEGVKKYEAGLAAFNQGYSEFKKNEDIVLAKKSELDNARSSLESSKNEIEAGKKSYAEGLSTLEKEVSDAKIQISDAQKKYDEGFTKFTTDKDKAEKEFLDADEKLHQAKRGLLEIPKGYFVTDRDGNPDYTSYFENAARIGKIAKIFPMFFFIVAALVSLTTITRMIEEERLQVGTLKALGYSRLSISSKYITYALLSSLLGSILGLAFGFYTFPKVIMTSYNLMYSIPPKVIEFNPLYALLSSLMAIVTATASAAFAISGEIRENPARLLQPKAPPAGSKILLERIPFIWKKLSFSRKVTFRNLFRYKKRLIMTLLGIAGCSGLLLTGFGIRDSLSSMVDSQFKKISKYDLYTIVDTKKDNKEESFLKMSKLEDVKEMDKVYQEKVNIKDRASDKKYEVSIIVFDEKSSPDRFVSLYDAKKYTPLKLSEDGIIITEKISELTGLKVNDEVKYRDSDNNEYKAKVLAISENYINNYMYMNSKAFKNIHHKEADYNGAYINLKNNEMDLDKIKKDLIDIPNVLTVVSTKDTVKQLDDQMKSLNIVVAVFILSAGLLAFVVLYNLSNVNINERIRELATIKVLGFRDKETDQYIMRENLILTIIGSVSGLFLGILLHQYIMKSVEVDNMTFVRIIKWPSYIYALLLTFFFNFIVNRFSSVILKKINMVESLKSVE